VFSSDFLNNEVVVDENGKIKKNFYSLQDLPMVYIKFKSGAASLCPPK
jgi:hypothetical protein